MLETLKYPKLRGRIVENYGTIGNFAKAIGKSVITVSKKLNCKSNFSKKDIREWSDKLNIADEDLKIFFEI